MKCPKCHFNNPDTTHFCGECGTQLQPSKDIPVTETIEKPKEELTTGSTFAGRYQIIEELGKGGMGKVYKALDKEVNEKIALKLIKPEIAADKKTIERFRNELKFARKIGHKNVCRMYDLNKEEGTYYIMMEYISGEDLKSFIRRSKQLTTGTAISIAIQACEGLVEAHRLGVVHRDLKPQNIMIDKEGDARIMDFGIARSLKAKGITGAGVMIGTPEYMSPEQVEGKEVDQRSDIYSLGVILYEMVTGRVPFEGDTPFTIGVKHKSEEPKDPRELNTQISDDLNRVILRCMEKDKGERYQSAGEVRSELISIEKGIPATDRDVIKRKPTTSKEITVTFSLKKFLFPALVIITIAIAAVVVWKFLSQKEPLSHPSGKPSIAVLPFVDLSAQKDQEYLCDGLAETLINALAKIKDLHVPARTSAFSFKGEKLDIREIGERLNVETVLEGSVQKVGDTLRITAKLINVADDYHLWSQQFEQKADDIFAIQDEISLTIVNKLKVNLLGEEKTNLVKRYTKNLDAYNLYLKGRFFWNTRSEDGLKKAIEYFNQAIEKDQNYALAYAGLADSYNLLGEYDHLPPNEAFPEAKAAALKALEIDNTLSEAYTSLAWTEYDFDWNWKDAEKKFKKAIELNPAHPTAHHWYAFYLARMTRTDEAIKEIKRALELDPLSLIINRSVGVMYYYARQYKQAEEALQRTVEMNPNFFSVHYWLGLVYLQKSMYEEALREFQEEKSISKDRLYVDNMIGVTYARMGKRDKAVQILQELKVESKRSYLAPGNWAILYFALGDNNQGFKYLDKAYRDHDSGLAEIKIDPFFDSVRSDPRFKTLLKKMGLE